MVNYQTLKLAIAVLSFLISLNAYSQTEIDKEPTKPAYSLNNRFEIGFTPRFVKQKYYKNSEFDSTHFTFYEGIHRFQLGMNINSNHYIHIVYDFFIRDVSHDFPYPEYKDASGQGFSLQYNYKLSSLTSIKYVKLFSKRFNILISPEFITTFGMNNMYANYDYSSLKSSNKWNPYLAIGTIFSFRLSKWFDLGLIYQLEYFPAIKSWPFRSWPIQTKFNFKF